eukprot:jgi/Chlat1/4915/Chrsp31S04836
MDRDTVPPLPKLPPRRVDVSVGPVQGRAASPTPPRTPPSVRWLQLQERWRHGQLKSFQRRQEIEARLQRWRISVHTIQAANRFARRESLREKAVRLLTPKCIVPDDQSDDAFAVALKTKGIDNQTDLEEVTFDAHDLPSTRPLLRPASAPIAEETGHRFGISLATLVKLNEERSTEALAAYAGVEGIAKLLHVSPKDGISDVEADQEERRNIYSSNTYPEKPPKPVWRYFWDASKDFVLRILAVCAAVGLAIGLATEGTSTGWYDGVGIFVALALVICITAGNDLNQARQFRKLNQKKKNIPVQVTRGGRRIEISIYDIVVGDVVHLNLGDQVAADGLLLKGFSLICDESSMTGESKPVEKSISEKPYVISGTKVIEGYGDMLVTAVGLNTEWGRVMSTVTEEHNEQTPLQKRLEVVALGIGKVGLLVAVLVFIVLTARYLAFDLDYKNFKARDLTNFVDFFAEAVTIIVVAIPEGLPLAVTLSLAYSMRKMTKDNALVRHLAACEVMGGATTICSDKTGTLTTNKMVVVRSWLCNTLQQAMPNTALLSNDSLKVLREGICLNSNGSVYRTKTGEVEITGKPTETAVLSYGVELGADYDKEREAAHMVKVEPFNSAKKRMGVLLQFVLQLPSGEYRLHWKGATEVIIGFCSKFVDEKGNVTPMTDAKRTEILALVDDMASQSLRTLCLAYADIPSGSSILKPTKVTNDDGTVDETKEPQIQLPTSDLICQAIVGIKDPCREGVPEAVQYCQRAGIVVRMVTGDYITTAKAIARECNILTDDGIAMEGPDFRAMPKEELLKILPRLQVLARSSPTDKQTLVKYLRELGNVVAVTGDGTNDAPALHQADVGLSMGISGTEIAKESSDIIILDDNFRTVVPVVRWGRSIFENIRKFIQFQLTVNIVALTLNFVTAAALGIAPLTVVQLLWVNLIMDTLGALALGTEPPQEKFMQRKPYGRTESLISNVMWRNMIAMSVYQLVVLLVIQFAGYNIFGLERPPATIIDPKTGVARTLEKVDWVKDWNDTRTLNTIIFNTFVFMQVFNEFTSRDMEDPNIFKGLIRNHIFITVIIVTCAFQFLIVTFLNNFANTNDLSPARWGWCILLGFIGMPIGALVKLIKVPREPTFSDYLFNKFPKLRRIFLGKNPDAGTEADWKADLQQDGPHRETNPEASNAV